MTNLTTVEVLVCGGTPAGIAAAVRCAREGHSVLLVQHTNHLGGMLAGGLGVMDTLHDGPRSPLYDEICQAILAHYRTTYGENSAQYQSCKPGPRSRSGARLRFESRVAEEILTRLIKSEPRIQLALSSYVARADCHDRIVRSVLVRTMDQQHEQSVTARVYIDATYEGDLAAAANAPYRVGRESREEFHEPHAGRIFTITKFSTAQEPGYPKDAVDGKLNLRPFRGTTAKVLPGSTGEGDRAIQAYNFRVCLTSNPNNRVMIEKPADYDHAAFFTIRDRWGVPGPGGINDKGSWNSANLVAGGHEYPEMDWPSRAVIAQKHKDFAMGLLWFLQNDPQVPAEIQSKARQCGLAKDEFTANGNFPYEMYVREARRIVGRYVFTEHDAVLASELGRAPIHSDSIAIAEWPMDSHDCTRETLDGVGEGKVLLSEETRPSQIPYRCLLPQGIDNLLVPVCLSCTHIGWGTIRLEPTWMHIAESAGFAASMAIKSNTTPAELNVARVQQALARAGVMLTFFSDVNVGSADESSAALQVLGTLGFFPTYDARPLDLLKRPTAELWAEAVAAIAVGRHDTMSFARHMMIREEKNPVSPEEFEEFITTALTQRGLSIPASRSCRQDRPLTRAAAAIRIDHLLQQIRGETVQMLTSE